MEVDIKSNWLRLCVKTVTTNGVIIITPLFIIAKFCLLIVKKRRINCLKKTSVFSLSLSVQILYAYLYVQILSKIQLPSAGVVKTKHR